MRWLVLLVAMATPVSAQDVPDPADFRPEFAECIEGYLGQGETPEQCRHLVVERCEEQHPFPGTMATAYECFRVNTHLWDELLNLAYGDAMERAREVDEARLEGFESFSYADQLKKAQRAWIVFRDLECHAQYVRHVDGTLRDVIDAECLNDMTVDRAIDLLGYAGEF